MSTILFWATAASPICVTIMMTKHGRTDWPNVNCNGVVDYMVVMKILRASVGLEKL